MNKLSKLTLFLFINISLTIFAASRTNAQVPQINLSCAKTDTPEFHSLRPYQAAACGDAPKARYCSNRLVFFEDFDVAGKGDCKPRGYEGNFTCHPDFQVEPHDLEIDLDDSQFPILGNTEDVKNYENNQDLIDDATKVNEYASWYLNGVNDKAENEEATDDQIINFSGPVKKLLPSVIQDDQRIKIIKTATNKTSYYDEELGKTVEEAENHDQIVVNNERLSSWTGDLSFLRSIGNVASDVIDFITNGLANQYNLGDAWNQRTPPLPWDDGTGKPFENSVLYNKAYNEWEGKSCLLTSKLALICIDNPLISNKYADLWHFVPLSNNSDKKGANYLLTIDGPSYDPSNGTEIENAMHKSYTNAPLHFAHTQEVQDLSQLLKKTYAPEGVKSEKVPETTGINNCSAVEVRTNKGDNLFPGDTPEITATGVQYKITAAECKETISEELCCKRGQPNCPNPNAMCTSSKLKCNAEVGVIFALGTKTPWADDIFQTTVAGSDSTFRKIFPKVQEGAPVSCIADIPTTTSVTYDPSNSEKPKGGEYTFRVQKYPKDSGGDTPELTFPHIGSIYEYFLNGIQTALRPKGYGNPIVSGECIKCGELPDLPKATGSCNLTGISSRVGEIPQSLKDIVSAAAETYKVPPNLILGQMFGEGLFNPGRYDWTDDNVKAWATCTPIPDCNDGQGDDGFMGFFSNSWDGVAKAIKPDLLALDPNRQEPSRCNLLDAVYGAAWNLHDSADGGMPFSCFGIDLNSTVPTSCSWNDNQYESAIKVAESGYTDACFTKVNSCATGGGVDATCPSGGDTCEKISSRYSQPSHNACVWDVAHGN